MDLFSELEANTNPPKPLIGGASSFKIHARENNAVSEKILNDNRVKFTKQAKKVLDILQTGEVLTQLEAAIKYKVYSLSTRVCDLQKKENGFDITRKMSKERGVMEYYCTPAQIIFNKNLYE